MPPCSTQCCSGAIGISAYLALCSSTNLISLELNVNAFSLELLLQITVKSLIFAGILFRVFVILCLCNSLKFAFMKGL
jgi:hypothetical protein